MVIKVAVPHQFKLKVIPDLKTLFFVDRKDIHYIGGSDILPAPLASPFSCTQEQCSRILAISHR